MEQNDTTTYDSRGAGSTTSVELPSRVVARVDGRLERSEFDTVEEYVTYVLEEVLARVEDATETDPVESVDREEIETRLKSLGYLD